MRLFIAIELPDHIRNALAQIQSHLKYAGADVKWVEKDNIHLTLKFLGEVPEEKCEMVKSLLDQIAKGTKPFDISIKDIGAFPKIDYPRVIWVGLDKGASESVELAKKIDGSLSKLGFQEESRPFAAHLTIGRLRSPKNRAALKEKIMDCKIGTVPTSSENTPTRSDYLNPSHLVGVRNHVTSIILFRSTLTPKGAIYTKLHESQFGL